VTVGVELAGIQVGVGIDQHRKTKQTGIGAGFSAQR
jgi:hypothetical protein